MLCERLSRAIRELHTRIESLPVAQAMAAGTIEPRVYLSLLEQLERLHVILEERLGQATELAGLYEPGTMARASDLQADLEALGAIPGEGEMLAVTQRFFGHLAEEWADAPAALLGCLYVLEGSRMGSLFLAGRLAAALGVEARLGQGLDYHLRGAAGRVAGWRQFKAALDGSSLANEQGEMVERAAVETMQLLHDLYEAVGAGCGAETEAAEMEVSA